MGQAIFIEKCGNYRLGNKESTCNPPVKSGGMEDKMKNQRKKDIWKKLKNIALILALSCSIITIYSFVGSKVNIVGNKVVEEDKYNNEETKDVISNTIQTGDKSPVIQGDGNTVNYIESELETDKPKSVAVLKDITLEYLSAEDDRINNIYSFDIDSLSGEEKNIIWVVIVVRIF